MDFFGRSGVGRLVMYSIAIAVMDILHTLEYSQESVGKDSNKTPIFPKPRTQSNSFESRSKVMNSWRSFLYFDEKKLWVSDPELVNSIRTQIYEISRPIFNIFLHHPTRTIMTKFMADAQSW